MPDYVIEAAMKQIKTRLEAIAVVGGYQNTIASVQRELWQGQTVLTIPAIFMKQGAEEPIEEVSSGANTILRAKRPLALAILTRPTEAETRSVDELINSLYGDVMKALLTEPRTFGGYLENVRFTGMTEFDPEDGKSGEIAFGLAFDLEYRYRTSDPTQQT